VIGLALVWSVLLAIVSVSTAYLWFMALASTRRVAPPPLTEPHHRFAILVPARNEERVIGRTLALVRRLDYPQALFDVCVVADHCTDRTAEIARRAGAACLERTAPPAGSKGAALNWLQGRILATGEEYDAFVVLDADCDAPPNLLRCMDAQLAAGGLAIQARAGVANPESGWYPALRGAMVIVDERLHQAARSNLGLSVRPSGWGFCVHRTLAESTAWPTGLTEDMELRWRLLANGVTIRYEPRAVVQTRAPLSWRAAALQRARWLVGASQSSSSQRRALATRLRQDWDPALLDGLAQMTLPSYSSSVVLTAVVLLVQLAMTFAAVPVLPARWLWLHLPLFGALIFYPFLGLALEGAPLRAFLAILTGPAFIVWRTGLAVVSRLRGRSITWAPIPRESADEP